MRVLVVGVGVIGSYLTHALCEAGNDVTVVARGERAQTLRDRGLVIHHWAQRRTTTDHPLVLDDIPTRTHFDAAFSVMRQDQQMAALPQLASIDANVLVLVGNDVRAQEASDVLEATGRTGRVLFGFQSTAGNRERDHVECVRWGATGLDVGPLHGEPSQADRDLLAQVFTKAYQPHWTHDFGDWLLTHAAAVVPMTFASYICGCDLHKASNDLLRRMIAAQAEGYALLERCGHQILPESDQGLFDSGIRRRLWFALVWAMAHTPVGTLCVDDHCKHAPDEMRALDESLRELRTQVPDATLPTWDGLYAEMGGWDQVLATWQ